MLGYFDAEKETDHIIEWAKSYFGEQGKVTAFIGVSGGKDSSITAALLAQAIGRDRVLGVRMPNGDQADADDAKRVVRELGIPWTCVNIAAPVSHLMGQLTGIQIHSEHGVSPLFPSVDAEINLPPRIRMATLYALAQSMPGGGRVINTCNWSEDFLGYSTKFGDAAGDVGLLGDYLATEVVEIGRVLARRGILSLDLVEKTPADGLCGKSDEDRFGFTYEVLDRFIRTGECGDEAVKAKILKMHAAAGHKLKPMPKCERVGKLVRVA